MRIFITGGSGFIGRHIVQALSRHGHSVSCLVRPGSQRLLERMGLPNVHMIRGSFGVGGDWLDQLSGHDVLINCVGIIREAGVSTFQSVHADSAIRLFEAAQRNGVGKIIQVSALGADQSATSEYHRTKLQADDFLRALGIDYLILRPSFVYGPGDQSMTFFASLAALPVVLLPDGGSMKVQPVLVTDLVKACRLAVENGDIHNHTVDLGGKEAISFRQMLEYLGEWLGLRQRRWMVPAPGWLMDKVAQVTDWIGRGPINSEELGMLRRGSRCSAAGFREVFAFEPVGFPEGLARNPASVATRLQAYFTHLRLPLRAMVGFIWVWTGLVSLLFPLEQALQRLADVGIPNAVANPGYYPLCLFEIALGLGVVAGIRPRLTSLIQLGLIGFFTLMLSLGTPELWLEPFGPVSKNVPLIGAILCLWILEECFAR